jgi:hypothetical protein
VGDDIVPPACLRHPGGRISRDALDQLQAAVYAVDALLPTGGGVALFVADDHMILGIDNLAADRTMPDRCITAAMIQIGARVRAAGRL